MGHINFTKKIVLLLILGISLCLLPNCWGGGGSDTITDYLITDISIIDQVLGFSKNSTQVVEIENGIELDSNQFYGMQINFKDSIVAVRDLTAMNLNFINSSYANEPILNTYNLLNGIDSIRIATILDFDSLHPANSDITALFNSYQAPINRMESFNDAKFLTEGKWYGLQSVKLALPTKPITDSIMQFRVRVFFDDQTVTVLTTDEIHLKQ